MKAVPLRHTLALLLFILGTCIPATGIAQNGGFDHSAFDRLLRANVNATGLVDYAAFDRSDEFRRYLNTLAAADLGSLSRNGQLALWINAYNAYTIALINRKDRPESIRDINRTLGIGPGKPWSIRIAKVGGKTYTLDEIEHNVIRPQFEEPRIHFALVCAALGCPPLRREAYTGARLNAQLDEQARRFLAESPARNRVDVSDRQVHLSPIFKWYKEDFGNTSASVQKYVARFFRDGPERALLASGNADLSDTDYDWSLNRQAGGG
ncbi:MAG: DUF547 domain-containing protein [Longimicrobiaceae bacterium]